MKAQYKLKFELNKFSKINDDYDWTTDMPNYWVCYFKMDGDTCHLDIDLNLKGEATVISPMEKFESLLHHTPNSKDEILVPTEFKHEELTIKPIKVPEFVAVNGIDSMDTLSGCFVIFINDDCLINNELIDFVKDYIQNSLNDFVPYLIENKTDKVKYLNLLRKDLNGLIIKKLREKQNLWEKLTSDFIVDTSVWAFTSEDLSQTKNVSLIKYWGIEGLWKLEGKITIEPTPQYHPRFSPKTQIGSSITVKV